MFAEHVQCNINISMSKPCLHGMHQKRTNYWSKRYERDAIIRYMYSIEPTQTVEGLLSSLKSEFQIW